MHLQDNMVEAAKVDGLVDELSGSDYRIYGERSGGEGW